MGTNQRASIVLSADEIADFVAKSRTGTLATIGSDGQPHLTAMWYAVVDGEMVDVVSNLPLVRAFCGLTHEHARFDATVNRELAARGRSLLFGLSTRHFST